ncbi:phosphatidylinositol transfer protein alpha isoform-like isoform X1 [Acanthaster planci]|uniref:Phosphatidylinositol transfer protein alpha isoform-like isoform X1 n=1 Tax=Acanthaster planci TaxID=133434 RepID=A0A8B7Y7L5_ACAPL|nr:phosphatidylinositol transfer protein alpha isoform-like isoform X1 [Acanthaster planci]
MHFKLLMWLVAMCLPGGNAIIFKEYRIPLPFSREEYRIAHLWSTAEWSLLNTGGGDGVEIIVNEERAFDNGKTGQYTDKIFHVTSKVPRTIRALSPRGSLEVQEISKNAFTEVETVLSSPLYMKNNFHLTTYTRLKEADNCQQDDVFNDIYYEASYMHGEVINIDITRDIDPRDYKEDEDPTKCFTSERLNLTPDWQTQATPMCVYKLVVTEFKWWGLSEKVEKMLVKAARRYFMQLHRQMYCWADQWFDFTIEDIREMEEEMEVRLDKKRHQGQVTGMSEN